MTELRTEKSEDEFNEVLANPYTVGRSASSAGYEVFEFKNGSSERPLVVYFGLGTTAMTAMGRAYLQEYLNVIDRPIITLQPLKNEWKNFRDRGENDAQIFDTLGIDEMDVVGASSGALLAEYVAVHAGERVRHLVTASCVGTKEGYGEYIKSLPGQFIDGFKESVSLVRQQDSMPVFTPTSSNFFNVKQYGELIKTIQQAVAGSLWDTAPLLHEDTKWTDIVGTKDHMTSYKDHVEIIRERNRAVPRSSSVYLLGGESHMWAVKRSLLAKLVDTAINEKNNPSPPTL